MEKNREGGRWKEKDKPAGYHTLQLRSDGDSDHHWRAVEVVCVGFVDGLIGRGAMTEKSGVKDVFNVFVA